MSGRFRSFAVITAGVVVMAAGAPWAQTGSGGDGPPAVAFAAFDQGGGTVTGPGVRAGAALGTPHVDRTDGNSPIGVGSAYTAELAGDACPTLPGGALYDGCPAGVGVTTSLKVVDQRASAECRSCTTVPDDARVKVFDRTKLDGLRLGSGRQATVLTKNPEASLYDDIFEDEVTNSQATAGDFGCVGGDDARCTAGVDAPGDLLTIVRFSDGATNIYAGRQGGPASFTDTDADGAGDLLEHQVQVQKTIDKRGRVSYVGLGNVTSG